MEIIIKKTIFATITCAIILENAVAQQYQRSISEPARANNYLDIEPPNYYVFNPSPLRNQQSLLQQPYFNFLNTLYRHDQSKSNLFTNPPAVQYPSQNLHRQKRAVVFRPLFVYRQQEVRKQKIQEARRRRYRIK